MEPAQSRGTPERPATVGDLGGRYTVDLEAFAGPLDLLLYLIRREEVDIYDIPISRITEQYLAHLKMMEHLNITVAGDFLVMAATLIYIKSRLLLPLEPTQEGEEPAPDPRQELVERLLEHERFRKAAHMLYERETVELSVWPRGGSEFDDARGEVVNATVFDLVASFHRIVERYREQVVLSLEDDPVSVEEKIAEIRRLLRVEREILFSFFLQRKISRLHLAVTLCALLELTRLREIRLFQQGLFEDIRIVAC